MNNSNDKLKEIVKQKYSDIALQGKETGCCCGSTPQKEVYNIMSDDYSTLEGYNEDADLGLGCGLPTQYAGIKKGDTVIDLGSGAGNDCFIAQAEVGNEGKVICKEKPIIIPDEILEKYLNEDEINSFKTINGNAIVSITVTGTKNSGGCSCGGCC